MKLVDSVVEHLQGITGLTGRQVREQLSEWKLVPYLYNKKIAGVGMVRDTELHFFMLPECRIAAFKRQAAREFIGKLLRTREYLTTRVLLGDEISKKFVTRFGFQETRSDETYRYFILYDLPFNRQKVT